MSGLKFNKENFLKGFQEEEFASIYRAARWLAFGELIIDEATSSIAYGQTVQESERQKVNEAYQAIQLLLSTGDLTATGMIVDGEVMPIYQIEIPRLFWSNDFVRIDWEKSSAHNDSSMIWLDIFEQAEIKSSKERDKINKYKTIEEIEISISEFRRYLEPASAQKTPEQKTETRGRKPKYDWDAFYIEIGQIANTIDGLPETQAELEKQMAEWCEQEWQECPGDSTIRGKISSLYQEDKKARK